MIQIQAIKILASYHPSDDTLSDGSARFSADDTFAALETTPREVAYSSMPTSTDTNAMIYKVLAKPSQEAGQYTTRVIYIAVPVY